MSSCLIIQTQNEIFIGADTASSVNVGGKFYRLNNNFKKLHVAGNEIVFAAGELKCVNRTLAFVSGMSALGKDEISKSLRGLIDGQRCSEMFDLELVMCGVKNGRSIARQFSQYHNFRCIEHTVNDEDTKILAAGLRTQLLADAAYELLALGHGVLDTFKKSFSIVACNEIGGALDVYRASNQSVLLANYGVDEQNIEYIDVAKGAISGNAG